VNSFLPEDAANTMADEESLKNALETMDSLKKSNVDDTGLTPPNPARIYYVCAMECTNIVNSKCEQPLLSLCGPNYFCEFQQSSPI
jgi:hypothetical protein